ncbi:hypothetical protein [Geovibrio ferrireducens]|uniref:hypothetical protein n=1 Tax=Geovibrio ferrireducens TaxID=46201 RepID=UPI002245806D|nr:hypothetical protein [Geovibrio ferrireducens]
MKKNDYLYNVCRDFLFEKISQRVRKSLNESVKSTAVGLETEESLRRALQEITKLSIMPERIGTPCVISHSDFVSAGMPDRKSYAAAGRAWGQCDLVFRRNREILFYGEIKTTTSALTNTLHLINVAVTSLRVFNKPLLNIILYPDKHPLKLREDYCKYSDCLIEKRIISESEYKLLKSNLYILTNQTFDTNGGVKHKLKDLNLKDIVNNKYSSYDDIIKQHKLLNDKDLNFSEWERLLSCLNTLSYQKMEAHNEKQYS